MSASSLPQCGKCGNSRGPWRPSGEVLPSGEQVLVCGGCVTAAAVAELGALPMPTGDPLAYGPSGIRCGCGKDAHSNLVPCTPEPTAEVDRLRARVAELEATSPWERAVAGLNALVDAGIAFWIEPDGHISGPFGDEHIEWDHDAARWRLTHDEDDDVHPPHPAPCRVPNSPDCTCPVEDPHDSPLHHTYAVCRDLPEAPNVR